MASAPATLPISNPQSVAAAAPSSGAAAGTAPVATPAFRRFFSLLSDSVSRSFYNRRPWSELLDRSAFSRPDSLSDAAVRVRKNFAYFRVNYVAVVAAVLAISLLSNPFSLLVLLGLLAAWCFLYLFRPADPPLVIFGRTFSDRETLGSLVLLSIFVIFLTSVGSLIISALLVQVDENSDVYSYGVVLMEMVTGRRPVEVEYGEGNSIVDGRVVRGDGGGAWEVLDPAAGFGCKEVREEMIRGQGQRRQISEDEIRGRAEERREQEEEEERNQRR